MTDTKVKYTASGVYIDKKDAVKASNRILTDALNGGTMTDTPKPSLGSELVDALKEANRSHNKPREWKVFGICAAEKGSAAFEMMQPPFVHVIEHSAYQSAVDEIARLKAQVQLKCVGIEALIDDQEKLTKERDEAVAKANKYFNDWSRAHHLYGEALERAERAEVANEEFKGLYETFQTTRKELTALRERAAGLVSALKACMPSWLPEGVRDMRRKALKDWEGEK